MNTIRTPRVARCIAAKVKLVERLARPASVQSFGYFTGVRAGVVGGPANIQVRLRPEVHPSFFSLSTNAARRVARPDLFPSRA